jgi:hypothetical protein
MFWFLKKQKFQVPATGCIPSPEDKRDLLLSQVAPIVKRYPKEAPPPFDLDILNQDGKPHCVGYSCAALKQYFELKERNAITFDGDWIYQKAKEIDGAPNLEGTYLRAGLKVLQKFGAKPLNGSEEEAEKYKIGTYVRVDDYSFEGLKKALYIGGILLAGFYGSNEGWQTAYVRPPNQGEKVWGHAVLIIGYNKNYLIGQNSWGTDWGDKGLFYIPSNYPPFEAWTVMDLPDYEEGWCAAEYLRTLNLQEGALVKPVVGLKLRESPGLSGKVLTILSPSQTLQVVKVGAKIDNFTWVKVKVIEEK